MPTSLYKVGLESKFSEDFINILHKLYPSDFERAVQAIIRPFKRYYFRVNTLKSNPETICKKLSSKDFNVKRDDCLEEALYLEVEGPNEISLYPKTIVVDKFTAEAVLQGAHIYAPGVMSCKKLKQGDKVAILDEKEQHIANGVMEMKETEILTFRKGLAVKVIESIYTAPSLRETNEYNQGEIYLQSLPAMITSKVLDPKPHEVIVDFNCSPGGKLSHICQLTQNAAKIYGMDRTKNKITQTRENLNRLGCKNIILSIQDTRYLDQDYPHLKADKCLIDPPCSALGVTPKVFDEITLKDIRTLAGYQKQFLPVASRILKSGGKVVYSVCTITIEECEEVVDFAQSQCDLEPVAQTPTLGTTGFNLDGKPITAQRFHPHIHGMGYFIALFKKSE